MRGVTKWICNWDYYVYRVTRYNSQLVLIKDHSQKMLNGCISILFHMLQWADKITERNIAILLCNRKINVRKGDCIPNIK